MSQVGQRELKLYFHQSPIASRFSTGAQYLQVMPVLFQPLKPMLLTMRKEAFDDERYIFEPKWDGWRILLHKQGGHIEAFTRHGRRVTDKFPELREAADAIRVRSAVLDCEGVCIRDGKSVFDDFQHRGRLTDPRKIAKAAATDPVTFVAFDVLHTHRPHLTEPLIDRKARLHDIVTENQSLISTFSVEGNGIALKHMTEQRGWEGIVAKRKDSRYTLDVRSSEWIKVKNWRTIDTVIVGYMTEPHFALVVGLHFPTVQNKPVAVVEFGFTPDEKRAFKRVVGEIHTVKSKGIQWVEPRLCCRIRYLERTDNHHLRMATFEEFLPKKDPEACLWVC